MRPARVFFTFNAFLAIVLFLLNRHARFSSAQTEEATSTPCCGQENQIAPRQLHFPYYSLKDGFSSTVLFVSGSPEPLDFVMAVRSRSGQTVLAPTMTIQPQEKLPVDLATLLAEQGADIAGDFAEGSVTAYYTGRIMPLAGQLTMSNPARRMIFESEMVDNSPGLGLLPSELNGLWWGLGGGREATIVVTNTSAEAVTADLFLDFVGERHAAAPLVMRPFETRVLSVGELLGELKTSPEQAPEGGITIVPLGPRPSLTAQGKITDSTTGFSSTLNFLDPSLQHASALHASGVPIGVPSKDSPYAGLGTFVPHVIVRNLLGTPQTVRLTIEYPVTRPMTDGRAAERTDQDTSEEPATGLATLAPMMLGPYQTQDISLDDVFGLLPLPLPHCSIRVEYNGAPGTVVGEVSSIEARGDLVIDASRLANEGDGWAGSGAHPWRLDDETDSVLFLTNMSEKETGIGFQVQADGIHYHLTDLRLQPRETRAIDLRRLRDKQKPDVFGNNIPVEATDGSVLWIRLENVPVMGRLLVLRRNQGMASLYSCGSCPCPATFTGSVTLLPSYTDMFPGETRAFTGTALYVDCNGVPIFVSLLGGWSSNNPSVAKLNGLVGNSMIVEGVATGTATISVSHTAVNWIWYPPRCQPGSPPTTFGGDSSTCKVFTFTVSVAPSTVQPDAQTDVTVQTTPAVEGKQVTLQAQEVQYSGGHNHLNRPLGSFGASSGTTNAQGKFQTTYRASLFGGQETVKGTISSSTKTATLTVQISGLFQLADGENFNLIGSTAYHVLPNNHYGTAAANSDLVAISIDYAAAYPESILEYNDQSLPKGGLFDIGPTQQHPEWQLWQTPHDYHRLGTNCDVRKSSVPTERWADLEAIFRRYGTVAPEGDHWHLTL